MNVRPTRADLFTMYQLSRRRFLQGVALSGGASLLAACIPTAQSPSQASDESQSASTGESQAAGQATGPEAAKYGGTYRALFGYDIPTLDAALAFQWHDWWASLALLYNRLYAFDQDNQLVAELASALPAVSDDGLVYTIPLRQDVKYHNGETMTAQDVKFSFDRLLWPELESDAVGYNGNIAGSDLVIQGDSRTVSGVEVVDEQTIRITLKTPQAVFPALLTVSLNGIVPQKAVEDAGADWGVNTVIGTGPFKLVEWLPGDKITFERHADYFKPGLPYLDRVEVYLNVPAEERVLRWEKGEAEYVDYFDDAPADELARIQNDPALAPNVRKFPTPSFENLKIADNVAPFNDLRVRQAIAMALNKQALADSFGIGVAVPLDDIYTKLLPMYQPDFTSDYQYDPAAAKQLLAEAGFPDGIKGVDLYVWIKPDQAAIIQADLAKIGIDINLLEGEEELYQERLDSGEIPLRIGGFWPDFPDAYLFTTYLGCGGSASPATALYCTDEIQQLVAQSNLLPLNDPKRHVLFHRIQEIVVNETVYVIPLYQRNLLGLGQSYVKGETNLGLPGLEEAYLER